MFATVVSILPWNNLSGRHWFGVAAWYASIVLSVLAIVLGAQQTLLLQDLIEVEGELVQQRLKSPRSHGQNPSHLMLMAWQSPLMCLRYSLILFFAALTTHVLSPLVMGGLQSWDDDVKVSEQTAK